MVEARQVPGGVFLRRAHIEAEQRALRRLRPERGEHGVVDAAHAEAFGHGLGRALRLGQRRRVGAGRLLGAAMGEVEPGEVPAHGAVLQRRHRVRQPGVDQQFARR